MFQVAGSDSTMFFRDCMTNYFRLFASTVWYVVYAGHNSGGICGAVHLLLPIGQSLDCTPL